MPLLFSLEDEILSSVFGEPTIVFPGHVSLFGAEELHAEVNRFSLVDRQCKMMRDKIGYQE